MMCWLARFAGDPCVLRADGNYDRAHLIPQQRLRREYERRGYPQAAIDLGLQDRRIIVAACRHHHHAFDVAKTIRPEADEYPPEVHDYAEEWGWWFAGAAAGWLPLADDLRIAA